MFQSRFLFVVVFITIISCVIPSSSLKRSRINRPALSSVESSQQDSNSRPNLLFTKKLLNDVFAMGWKVDVEYSIFNVGDGTAQNVKMFDEDFIGVNSRFMVIQGDAELEIGSLAPEDSIRFNISAYPNDLMKAGMFQFTPAKVTYTYPGRLQEEGEIIGWSSLSPYEKGNINILSKDFADRMYSSKATDYSILVIMALLSVGLPFSLWAQHTSKYNQLHKESEDMRSLKKKLSKQAKKY